ncbi:hypothetical protein B566_EDAN003143, partial [Ephemera danica]
MATLGNEIWKNWDRQGKSDFLKHVKLLIDHADENASPLFNKEFSTNLELSKMIHELIKRGLQGSIRREACVSMIAELVDLHEDMAAIVTDILGIIDYLSEKLLKERLEIETLQEVGTLKNRNFYTKFIKVKTKLYYKQRKFNLLREESEGYAKLITELGQDLGAQITPQFILESFECRPEQDEFFVPLIRSYMADPKILSEVLGFKFSLYYPSSSDGSSSSTYTPESLYTLVPEDSSIQGEWDKDMKDAKEYVRKLNIISTKEKEEQPEETEPPADK